jgi:hypothetical protein
MTLIVPVLSTGSRPIIIAYFGSLVTYMNVMALFLLFKDRPVDPSKRTDPETGEKHAIQHDPFYLAYYLALSSGAGVMIGVSVRLSASLGLVVQSMVVQNFAIFVTIVGQILSLRATDAIKFSPLMIQIYYQVDLTQTLLFLRDDVSLSSSDFWQAILLTEVSSIFKNAGLMELVAHKIGLRKDQPFRDSKAMKVLRCKGLADTLSEIFCCLGAFLLFSVELVAKEWSATPDYTVTKAASEARNESGWEYTTHGCSATCVGWNANLGHPPPSSSNLFRVFTSLAVICLVRVACLGIEAYSLSTIETRYQATVVSPDGNADGRSISDDTVAGVRSDVKKIAVEVYSSVTAAFIFASFFIATNAVSLGFYVAAFTIDEDVTMKQIGG